MELDNVLLSRSLEENPNTSDDMIAVSNYK